MSDSYHYDEGANHYDNKKVLHLDKVQGADLQQLIRAFFKDDAKDVEVVEEVKASQQKEEYPHGNVSSLSDSRIAMLNQLLDFVDKGDWKKDDTANEVKIMLRTVLGQGEAQLTGKDAEMSEALWHLLENGRGDRVKIVWQNMVGYLDDKRLFIQKGSPALNRDFFGNEDGYSNIDKGRPSRDNMSSGFRVILPLLDAYVPKT